MDRAGSGRPYGATGSRDDQNSHLGLVSITPVGNAYSSNKNIHHIPQKSIKSVKKK